MLPYLDPARQRTCALLLALTACSYDASGLMSAGQTSSSSSASTTETTSATTTTSPTSGGPGGSVTDATTTGTTGPVDPTDATTSTSTSTSTTSSTTTDTSTSDTSTTTDPGTSTSTTSTTSSTSTTDTSDTSSTTGDPPPEGLVDDGLIVRYYLDEAMSGQGPMQALDAAPGPLHLPLQYAVMGGPNPVYTAQNGNRGLQWPAVALDGRATIPVGNTKVQQRLDTRVAATIEVVVDIDAVTDQGSRISHIGGGSEPGQFTLRSTNIQRLEFFWKGNVLAGVWPVDWVAENRAVVHLVFDSAEADAADRVRLYLDGQPVADGMDANLVAPNQNEAIAIPTMSQNAVVHYTLGNRGVDIDRSFQGVLFYAAMYDVALSDADIQHNAGILAAGDDTP